jgi:hypothetical protein
VDRVWRGDVGRVVDGAEIGGFAGGSPVIGFEVVDLDTCVANGGVRDEDCLAFGVVFDAERMKGRCAVWRAGECQLCRWSV